MAGSLGYPLPVLLLLTFAILAIASSKTEPQQQQQQQQQQSEAVVSELGGGTPSNSSRRVVPSSSLDSASSEDSTEDDDGEEEDSGGEEEEEEEEDEEEDDDADEEEGEDEASLESNEDEYEDELRALLSTTKKPDGDKEVSELLEYKRRKKEKSEQREVDKRVPTVKKELSSQKEILLADNETQSSGRLVEAKGSVKNELQETGQSYEDQPEYSVFRPSELPRKLNKRQSHLINDLEAYLLELEKLQALGAEEGLLAERLLKVLAENPQRWERVRQFLANVRADLDDSRRALETQKRLVQIANPFLQEVTSTLTTSLPPPVDDRPTRKPKKKKKKKKKLRHRNKPSTSATTTSITEATSNPLPPAVMATTETPWSSTQPPSDAKANWRLVAERLLQQPWSQDDESDVAKVRYSMPSKPRTLSPARRPLDDKERESLKALNSERQALMLKAAREYSQPRFMHFGKINTHQQTSSAEDLDDSAGYEANDRAYQRPLFGQLVSPSSSRLAYTRLREPIVPYPERPPPGPQYDVNFARNHEYLPPGREFAASKPWQADNPFRGGNSDDPPKNIWNWRQFLSVPKPRLPWHSERDYFARLEQEEEETAKAWQQAQQRQQQQQSWNRQNFRENLPPWLEEKEVQRMFQAQDSWPQPDKSREYGMHRKEEDASTWESSRSNNNSELKNGPDSKQHEEESPKLTMKTWNSLTSDPATWPFKLPGAKPWPKDENGKSYNPNAELVRKLGLYSKNGRLRPDKDPLKELKQQKLQKNEKLQGDQVQANDTRTIPWAGKEPEKQQSSWYNGMKIHDNFEGSPRWNSEKLPSDAWNLAAKWGGSWPNKWKQFAYHKVTAQPTSKSGVTLDKPGKNAFIAVSAVSSPRYGNEWRKNDIEEIGQVASAPAPIDPNDPTSQMRMNVWKKSSGLNETDKAGRIDVLENQLEDLKEKEGPVLLEVNVSIRNSTFRQTSTTSSTSTEKSEANENKTKDKPSK